MENEQREGQTAASVGRNSKAACPEESLRSQNDPKLQQSVSEAIVESYTPDFEQHRPSKVVTNIEESVPEQIEADKYAMSLSGVHGLKVDQKEQSI